MEQTTLKSGNDGLRSVCRIEAREVDADMTLRRFLRYVQAHRDFFV